VAGSALGVIATTYSFKPDNEPLTAFDQTTLIRALRRDALERDKFGLGGLDGHFRRKQGDHLRLQVLGTVV